MKILILLSIILFTATGCDNIKQINYQTNKNVQQKNIYGTFSTNITDKTPERLNNIQLGVQKLNGAKINPGEEFSFNSYVGPRNAETGFQEAIIFDGHGNKIDGYGGGVCQITSTLYNAVLNAGLEVTERHEHSRDVPYIEEGMDASVSYGSEDLKFKNTSSRVVTINASTDNDILSITIKS